MNVFVVWSVVLSLSYLYVSIRGPSLSWFRNFVNHVHSICFESGKSGWFDLLVPSVLGPTLLYYRTFLISILANAVFTLICGVILHFRSEWGFLMTMSGFDSVWTVFIVMELINNPQ